MVWVGNCPSLPTVAPCPLPLSCHRRPIPPFAGILQPARDRFFPFSFPQAFSIEDIIRPSDTRPLICNWIKDMYAKLEHGDTLGPGGGYVP